MNQMKTPLYGGCLCQKIGDSFGDSNSKTRYHFMENNRNFHKESPTFYKKWTHFRGWRGSLLLHHSL